MLCMQGSIVSQVTATYPVVSDAFLRVVVRKQTKILLLSEGCDHVYIPACGPMLFNAVCNREMVPLQLSTVCEGLWIRELP